jgi:hypothetical protein
MQKAQRRRFQQRAHSVTAFCNLVPDRYQGGDRSEDDHLGDQEREDQDEVELPPLMSRIPLRWCFEQA